MPPRSRGINIEINLDVKGSRQQLAKLTKDIESSIRDINRANLGLAKSQKKVIDLFAAEEKVLKRANKELKTNTQETRKNRDAQKSLQNATAKVIKETEKLTRSKQKVNSFGDAVTKVAAIIGAKELATGFLGAVTQVENLEVQMKTLLGTTEAAEKRMEELTKFASETPFQVEEIAEASRILETLTKGALSTGDGLTMVGDAAASTGSDFANLAMHVGRAYDGLKANRPIGESLMRLQELGLVAGDTRNQIEELQKAGRGKEAWLILESELSKTEGGMESLSQTTTGLFSTTKDLTNEFFRSVDALFGANGAMKGLLKTANEYLRVANETYQAEKLVNEQRERNKIGDIIALIKVRSKLQLRENLGLETSLKQRKKIGNLNKMIAERAAVAGKDELFIAQKSYESKIRILEALNQTAGATDDAIDRNELIIESLRAQIDEVDRLAEARKKAAQPVKEETKEDKDAKKLAALKVQAEGLAKLFADVRAEVDSVMDKTELKIEAKKEESDERQDKQSDNTEALLAEQEERTRIFNEGHEKRAELRDLYAEIEKEERLAMTGFLLEDNQRRAMAELELLEATLQQKKLMYKKAGKSTVDLEKRYAKQRENIILQSMSYQVNQMARGAGMIIGNMKAIFGETKALAIAEATIKGIQSTVNSFEYGTKLGGPILGGVFAATAAAATAAQIMKMSSQNFATGGMPTGRNAQVTMNERGQESILNASATARLGQEGVNRLNRGQSLREESSSSRPVEVNVSYSPSVTYSGSDTPEDIFSRLEGDPERLGELVSQSVKRGFA